jgi:hypothetical protein
VTTDPGSEGPIVVDSQAWTGNEAEAAAAAQATYLAKRRLRGQFLAAGGAVFGGMGLVIVLFSAVELLRGGGDDAWEGLLTGVAGIAFGYSCWWLGCADVRRYRA